MKFTIHAAVVRDNESYPVPRFILDSDWLKVQSADMAAAIAREIVDPLCTADFLYLTIVSLNDAGDPIGRPLIRRYDRANA